MKVEITTNAKSVEIANYLLSQAIINLQSNPAHVIALRLSNTDLKKAEAFRKSLVKGYVKTLAK